MSSAAIHAEAGRGVESATSAPPPDWDEFVRGRDDASVYHETGWCTLVEELFGHRAHYLWSRDAAGRIDGVLAMVRLRSRLFGDYMVSVPYVNYGGAIAHEPAIARALMAAAARVADTAGASHVEFRDQARHDLDWPVRTDKVLMLRDLPDDPDRLLKDIGAKVRAQVKRPLREGATEHLGGAELLGDFYRVFARNMRDLGTPVYSRRFFERILDAYPEKVRIAVVRVGAAPVAAGFLMRDRERMEIPWASSLREHNRIGVNMLLYWRALRHAIESGCTRFDFGRSSRDSGTYRFKRQWGAAPVQLHWHYWLASGAGMPGLNPDNPKYRLAIRLWQRLPVPVANAIGPHLVKNLP